MSTRRTVVLSNGARYSYAWPWDGASRLPAGSVIAFDTETEALDDLRMQREIPRLALATVSVGSASAFIHPSGLADWITAHRDRHLVMQNAAFDFWVVLQHLTAGQKTQAIEAWWAFAEEGRLHDTLILDQLLRLAGGLQSSNPEDDSISRRNLAELAKDYANLRISKDDPYRLRYGELIGRDWNDPAIEQGFWDYAIKDAIVTSIVYKRQQLLVHNFLYRVQKQFAREILPDAQQKYGLLSQTLQIRASIVLQWMSREGVRSDPAKVKAYEDLVRRDLHTQVEAMQALRPEVLLYRDECTKAGAISKAKNRPGLLPGVPREVMLTPKGKTPRMKRDKLVTALEQIATQLGEPVLKSAGKKKGTSISAKAWVQTLGKRSPFVTAWSTASKKAKLLQFFEPLHNDCYIRPRYNVLKRTGRTSCYKPNLQQCFDADTEVLTTLGFVCFPDAAKAELDVAQYDPSSGEISFVKPEGWVVQKAPGQLISLQNDHIDLVMTPEHRCLLRHRKKQKLEVFPASDYPEDYEQLHAGIYKGGTHPVLGIDALTLAIAFQADGAWGSFHKGEMDFSLKRPDKVKKLKALLDSLGLKYTLKQRQGRDGVYRFLVAPCGLTRKLYQLMGPKKLFGPWLLAHPREDLDHFCQEIWNWDAEVERRTAYASERRQNADWVQIILALSGRRAQVRVVETDSGKPSYQVDHTEDADASSTTGLSRSAASSPDGKVYCATVPTGYLVVRRGGKVAITGNCPRDAEFRGLFVARAGYKLMTVDYAYIELRTLAAVCRQRYGQSKLADTINAGKDPHTHTASLISGWDYALIEQGIASEKAAVKAAKAQGLPPPATPYTEARQSAKAVNFGVPGGLGAAKLAAYAEASYAVKMTEDQAATLRNRLINDIYPELARYLGDSSLDNLSWNLGLSTSRIKQTLGIQDEDEDEDKQGRMMRALAKVLRGTPVKADGTPYSGRFVARTWAAVARLVGTSTSPLTSEQHLAIKHQEGSLALERALLGGPAITLTGRLRGGCTYTQQRNTPFQGLAADGAKVAMWNLLRAGYRPLAFIHDELILELPLATAEADAIAAEKILNEAMTSVLGGHVSSASEYRLGDCWSK